MYPILPHLKHVGCVASFVRTGFLRGMAPRPAVYLSIWGRFSGYLCVGCTRLCCSSLRNLSMSPASFSASTKVDGLLGINIRPIPERSPLRYVRFTPFITFSSVIFRVSGCGFSLVIAYVNLLSTCRNLMLKD
jgi:hypothetical protein